VYLQFVADFRLSFWVTHLQLLYNSMEIDIPIIRQPGFVEIITSIFVFFF